MILSDKLYIVDSYAFLFKNYFALPKLRTSKNEEVGALYGFVRNILKLRKNAEYLIACYDSGKSYRRDIDIKYKSNRPKTDDSLINQINLSKDILKALGITTVSVDGYESDDIIATIVRKYKDFFNEIIIVGADKDLFQIIDDKVRVSDGNRIIDSDYIRKKYGIEPKDFFTYLVLVGDSSDNIKGVEGIGPKTAAKLIKEYGSIDNIVEKSKAVANDKVLSKIRNNIDDIELAKKLVKLDIDVPFSLEVSDLKVKEIDRKLLSELAERFEFSVLYELAGNKNNKTEKKAIKKDGDNFLNSINSWVSVDHLSKILVSGDIYADIDKDILNKLLFDSNVKKYFYNFKEFLTEYMPDRFDDINNYEDVYLLYYLVYAGSRKPDIKKIIHEFYGFDADNTGFYFKDISEKLLTKISEYSMQELYDMELKLSKVLYMMEKTGIKVDKGRLNLLSDLINKKIEDTKKEFIDVAGYDINLNSPKQVSDFLFKKLNIQLDDKLRKFYTTKSGNISTNESLLKLIKPYHPSIELIIKYREYVKLKSSFIDVLLEKITDKSRLHTTYNQTGTITGRLSSSNPNLQNIPVKDELSLKIRECFIPDDGFEFVSFDYSQIDLRVLAHLSEDERLIELFSKDADIHSLTASSMFSIPPDKVDKKLRKIAKTINFGIIYGQTPIGLSMEIQIDYDEARRYIDKYFEIYSGVKKWIDSVIEFAHKNNYVYNFIGRRRYLYDINSKNRALVSMSERMAVNMPVQSGSSDIIKKSMNLIYDIIKNNQDEIKMLLQIHDELLFEIKKDKINKWKKEIKNIMENVYKLKVPLKVDVKKGINWGNLNESD